MLHSCIESFLALNCPFVFLSKFRYVVSYDPDPFVLLLAGQHCHKVTPIEVGVSVGVGKEDDQ